MNVTLEETPEGWFYQLDDGPRVGPFSSRAAAEKDIHDRIAESLAQYTRETLFGN